MKSKITLFLVFTTFAAAAVMAPLQASRAGIAERPPVAASAPADDEGCGDVSAYDMTDTVVPSLTVTMSCDDCRFDENDRYALLRSYGEAARRAGYIVDPLNSSLFVITEIGVLANGTPFLKGIIGNNQVTVGDPFPGETLASVAGKLALVVVAGVR